MEQPPPADRDGNRPPARPEHWADRDRAFATQVRLSVGERTPERGQPPCSCGGTWRYVLLAHAAQPLWRCLHCGRLHRGDRPIPEGTDPPTG